MVSILVCLDLLFRYWIILCMLVNFSFFLLWVNWQCRMFSVQLQNQLKSNGNGMLFQFLVSGLVVICCLSSFFIFLIICVCCLCMFWLCRCWVVSGELLESVNSFFRVLVGLLGRVCVSYFRFVVVFGKGQVCCMQWFLMVGNRWLGWWLISSSIVLFDGFLRFFNRVLVVFMFIVLVGLSNMILCLFSCVVCIMKLIRLWI